MAELNTTYWRNYNFQYDPKMTPEERDAEFERSFREQEAWHEAREAELLRRFRDGVANTEAAVARGERWYGDEGSEI